MSGTEAGRKNTAIQRRMTKAEAIDTLRKIRAVLNDTTIPQWQVPDKIRKILQQVDAP